MKNIFTLLFILAATLTATAQQDPLRFRMSQAIPVSVESKALTDPWSGGVNTPQFSTIDLNQDGQEDLFVFDRQLQKAFTWLAVQENGQWRYSYAPEYEAFFPKDLTYWVLLRDYNCDGLKDIFTSSPLGIQVFRQEQAAKGKLNFSLATDALRYNSGKVNMQMNSADVPAITDIDGDGDLDVLLVEFSQGFFLELYRNVQSETNQPCGTLSFVQQTDWWGGITECEGCNNFKFAEHCAGYEGESVASPMHSGHDGSSLLLLDTDADGDKELVMGGVQCEDLAIFENKGNSGNAVMTGFNPLYPEIKPANFNIYPAAYYEDVTFDGVPDLLVAPQAYQDIWNMDFERSNWLYQNQGAADQPQFNFVQDDFLQNQMIDLGEGAFPAFADMDADGDLDMLIGNAADYRNKRYGASLSFYRNTGTATEAKYELVTNDFLGLHTQQVYNLKPAFADINGDGTTDLILTFKGLQAGSTRITYLQNLAKKGQPAVYDLAYLQTLLKVEDGSSPAFADLDNDGDLDLILGKAASNLEFYRNTGSITAPAFTLEDSSFGGIDFNFTRRFLYPAVHDLDGDGNLDLLTVDESGELRIYRNITQDLNATFTAETEVLENKLTEQVQATRLGFGLSITVAPLGGENKLYLALGSKGGGLYLLEQTAGNVANPETNGLTLQVYPNPYLKAGEQPVRVQASEPVQVEMYDMVGKRVLESTGKYSRSHTLALPALQSGVYIVRAVSETGKHTSAKLMVY